MQLFSYQGFSFIDTDNAQESTGSERNIFISLFEFFPVRWILRIFNHFWNYYLIHWSWNVNFCLLDDPIIEFLHNFTLVSGGFELELTISLMLPANGQIICIKDTIRTLSKYGEQLRIELRINLVHTEI